MLALVGRLPGGRRLSPKLDELYGTTAALLRPDLPAEVQRVIMRALDKSPTKRFFKENLGLMKAVGGAVTTWSPPDPPRRFGLIDGRQQRRRAEALLARIGSAS